MMSFYDPGADDMVNIAKELQKCAYCEEKASDGYDNGHPL